MVKSGMVKSANSVRLLKERSKNCLKKTLKLSYLGGLWEFLNTDAYMYGALLRSPDVSLRGGEAVIRKEVRKKKVRRIGHDVRFSKEINLSKKNQPVSQSTISYVNIQHGISTPEAHEKRDGGKNVSVSWHDNSETDDTSVADGDMNDTSKEYSTSLEEHEAEQVIAKLVNKFGGRKTRELGIEVGQGDEEVEKWFLAVALFNSDRALDWSPEVLKNIFSSGIKRLTDTLKMSQDETAKALENAGFESYPERTAARLHRLAHQLESQYGGTVCSLKEMTDASEVKRELSCMAGLSRSSAALFLREMEGVWPGASHHVNKRTEDAAKHLRIYGYKSNVSDERDVSAALDKLSSVHARHFRECPGGSDCEFL